MLESEMTPLRGYCNCCGRDHHLPAGSSRSHCLNLMRWLEKEKRIDYLSPTATHPLSSTDTLFGEARGKMFGVLEGITMQGNTVLLYGFSGQYNSLWTVPGWVPPLFEVWQWQQINAETERHIKKIGEEMEALARDSADYRHLKILRKRMSQDLMIRLHLLYHLQNFRGQRSSLAPFFTAGRGIPTGAGDCCAPKLIQYALNNNIFPTGISEFFWGESNRSGSRTHGKFYPACSDKCEPLMGFLLCGLDVEKT